MKIKYQVFELKPNINEYATEYRLISPSSLLGFEYYESLDKAMKAIKENGFGGVKYTALPVMENYNE